MYCVLNVHEQTSGVKRLRSSLCNSVSLNRRVDQSSSALQRHSATEPQNNPTPHALASWWLNFATTTEANLASKTPQALASWSSQLLSWRGRETQTIQANTG